MQVTSTAIHSTARSKGRQLKATLQCVPNHHQLQLCEPRTSPPAMILSTDTFQHPTSKEPHACAPLTTSPRLEVGAVAVDSSCAPKRCAAIMLMPMTVMLAVMLVAGEMEGREVFRNAGGCRCSRGRCPRGRCSRGRCSRGCCSRVCCCRMMFRREDRWSASWPGRIEKSSDDMLLLRSWGTEDWPWGDCESCATTAVDDMARRE